MPSWSSPSPSSSSAQIIPMLTSPRILPFLIVTGVGSPVSRSGSISTVPTVATGTLCPAATLGAPHTIWTAVSPPEAPGAFASGAALPMSTVQTRRRSALGCGSAVSTRPTTTPSSEGPVASTPSTSRPAIVRRSEKASGERPGST